MELVIDFNSNGSVQAMHSDKFDIGVLGPQSVERASDIRYDSSPEAQTWTIYLADPEGPFVEVEEARGFKHYEEARKIEVRWLNGCRLLSIDPLSVEGRNLLLVFRRTS